MIKAMLDIAQEGKSVIIPIPFDSQDRKYKKELAVASMLVRSGLLEEDGSPRVIVERKTTLHMFRITQNGLNFVLDDGDL